MAREAAESGLSSVWFGQTFGADSPQLAAIVGREVPGLQVGTSALTETGTADFHGELLTASTPVPARGPGPDS